MRLTFVRTSTLSLFVGLVVCLVCSPLRGVETGEENDSGGEVVEGRRRTASETAPLKPKQVARVERETPPTRRRC